MGWKLISVVRSTKPEKKWVAVFENALSRTQKRRSTTHFGAAGMEDFTMHKDPERRKLYRQRHRKDLETRDPRRAGFLSWHLLWGPTTSLRKNIALFKSKFNL